jgi:hypothetical protein
MNAMKIFFEILQTSRNHWKVHLAKKWDAPEKALWSVPMYLFSFQKNFPAEVVQSFPESSNSHHKKDTPI